MSDLRREFEKTEDTRVLVVGDIMLDRYTWGDAARVSPEAPVLVLRAEDEEVRLGGAASVACLLRHLGADVTIAGVVGSDPGGRTVRKLLGEIGVGDDLLLVDSDRCTTTKERFVGRAASRHPHQILRVDRESTEPLGCAIEDQLVAAIDEQMDGHQTVLVSDYAKGLCSPRLMAAVVRRAAECGIPVLADPARIPCYERYRGMTVLTPNRVEAELATGRSIADVPSAFTAGRNLLCDFDLDAVLLTQDKDGIAVITKNNRPHMVPTRQREVYDITGAGDMVLAVAGLCQASGLAYSEAASLANVAAGLQVERLGVAPITRDEMLAELAEDAAGAVDENTPVGRASSLPFPADSQARSLRHDTQSGHAGKACQYGEKRITLDEMVDLAERYRGRGRRVVFTNGCFDLLHIGHITYLQEAARSGDVLVVAVNSDATVRSLKGPDRPLVGQADRAATLAALDCVDHVLIFDEPTPVSLIRRIRPDVLVKGGDYRLDQVVGHEVVESYGGQVRVTAEVAGVSTTEMVASIRETR